MRYSESDKLTPIMTKDYEGRKSETDTCRGCEPPVICTQAIGHRSDWEPQRPCHARPHSEWGITWPERYLFEVSKYLLRRRLHSIFLPVQCVGVLTRQFSSNSCGENARAVTPTEEHVGAAMMSISITAHDPLCRSLSSTKSLCLWAQMAAWL